MTYYSGTWIINNKWFQTWHCSILYLFSYNYYYHIRTVDNLIENHGNIRRGITIRLMKAIVKNKWHFVGRFSARDPLGRDDTVLSSRPVIVIRGKRTMFIEFYYRHCHYSPPPPDVIPSLTFPAAVLLYNIIIGHFVVSPKSFQRSDIILYYYKTNDNNEKKKKLAKKK